MARGRCWERTCRGLDEETDIFTVIEDPEHEHYGKALNCFWDYYLGVIKCPERRTVLLGARPFLFNSELEGAVEMSMRFSALKEKSREGYIFSSAHCLFDSVWESDKNSNFFIDCVSWTNEFLWMATDHHGGEKEEKVVAQQFRQLLESEKKRKN